MVMVTLRSAWAMQQVPGKSEPQHLSPKQNINNKGLQETFYFVGNQRTEATTLCSNLNIKLWAMKRLVNVENDLEF